VPTTREPIIKFRNWLTAGAAVLLVATGFAWFIGAFSLSWNEVLLVILIFAGMIWLDNRKSN
jgi:FtsH-binding integral membrane protein